VCAFFNVPACSLLFWVGFSIDTPSNTAYISTIRQYIIMTTEKTSTAMLNEFHWVNVFLSSLQIQTHREYVNEIKPLKFMAFWILFVRWEKNEAIEFCLPLLNDGELFFLIHTCRPCKPVSAATRQFSCVYKFHPNFSPRFLAHHDQCTGLELRIANTSFVNWF